jgi:hypothetical protein
MSLLRRGNAGIQKSNVDEVSDFGKKLDISIT